MDPVKTSPTTSSVLSSPTSPTTLPPKPIAQPQLPPEAKQRLKTYRNIVVVAGILIGLAYVLAAVFLFLKPPTSISEGPVTVINPNQLPDSDLWLTTYVVADPPQTPDTVVDPGTNFQVQLEVNPTDQNLTDVYLADTTRNNRLFYAQLKNVYRESYHPAEYHQGNVYIVHRVSDNPVTDELWKYRADGKGRKLFSNPGLDFRVSDDNEHVVVSGSNADLETGKYINFLSGEGQSEQIYEAKELQVESLTLESWAGNTLWLSELAGPVPKKFVSITLPKYDLNFYSVDNLMIGKEYRLSPAGTKLAYSDYPVILDVDGQQDFEKTAHQLSLKVTDLAKKTTQTIATSTNKAFQPVWLSATQLEYTDPQSGQRIQKTIP